MLNNLDPGKRLLVYLVINIIVSALTALVVLALWTRFVLDSPPDFALSNPTSDSTSSQLVINAVIGAGDLENERVIIEHVGSEDVSLTGWRLRDESGAEYRFPALVLHPDAKVSLFSRGGDDSASSLYWDRQVAMWKSGEEASLIDPSGQVQATYTVP
ncbi:MAG: lamin tail domain-containing protein [Chloroflexi bacterium]|nr:lamin tail domain-containing protein [Chloroflexota bacterium]